jgi:anaerobic magnesium-protoporphyrin IX monomethyl ester cyclase
MHSSSVFDLSDRSVVFINPPVCDARAPHLALPALTAHLRRQSCRVVQIDADLEAFLTIMDQSHLLDCLNHVSSHGKGLDNSRFRLWEASVERVNWAIAALRSDACYNPLTLHAARNTIDLNLELAAIATSSTPLAHSISPLRFEHQGYDLRRLDHMISLCSAARNFPFRSYLCDQLIPRVSTYNPDLVCVSILNSQQLAPGLYFARELRNAGFSVVIGGTVLNKFTNALRRSGEFFSQFADWVIVNEGETALSSLLHTLSSHKDVSKVPNLIFMTNDGPRYTFPHVEDVRLLATPDFSDLPLTSYLTPCPVLPIYFGKGCYFNECSFCDIPSINSISHKPYRLREIDQVCDDLDTLHQQTGTHHFVITDEALAPTYLDRLSATLVDSGRTAYRFSGYARLEKGFTQTTCDRMAAAGFRKIYFGLESGSQRTLDGMRKGILVSDVPKILSAFNASGIRFHIFSMIGLPDESEGEAAKTFSFFETYKATVERPGNTYEIHTFSLDLRTEYYNFADSYGIEIRRRPAEDEFAIGLDDSEWTRTRGMSHARVAELRDNFYDELRRVFPASGNFPGSFWPMWEEYSLLYCDRYFRDAFPFLTSCSVVDSSVPISAELSADISVRRDGSEVVLENRLGSVRLDQQGFEWVSLLSRPPFLIAVGGQQPSRDFSTTSKQLRQALDVLCSMGMTAIIIPTTTSAQA